MTTRRRVLHRYLRLVCAVITTLATSSLGTAQADTDDLYCTFTLSPPKHIQIGSGGDVVTATLAPQHCNGTSVPTRSTVCVSVPAGPSDCRTAYAWNTSQVFLAPWKPGVVFTATGSGCSIQGNPAIPLCKPSGPITATL